jgi:hypothetical protein
MSLALGSDPTPVAARRSRAPSISSPDCSEWAIRPTISARRSGSGSTRRPPARKKNRPSSAFEPMSSGSSGCSCGERAGSVGRLAGSSTGSAPPRLPRNGPASSSSWAAMIAGAGTSRSAGSALTTSSPRPRAATSATVQRSATSGAPTSSCNGGESAATRETNPTACGWTSRCRALPAPADSPARVTRAGSPPNTVMFSATQRSAASWSARPQLALGAPGAEASAGWASQPSDPRR